MRTDGQGSTLHPARNSEEMCPLAESLRLRRKKSVEERPVALESRPERFGICIPSARPLLFQAIVFGREALGQPLHQLFEQRIGLPDCAARFVDEGNLNGLPAGKETIGVTHKLSLI